jgi:hypothetical protein
MNAEKHAKSRSGRTVSGEMEPIVPTKHARHATRRTASVGNKSQTPNRSVSTGPVMKPRKKTNVENQRNLWQDMYQKKKSMHINVVSVHFEL